MFGCQPTLTMNYWIGGEDNMGGEWVHGHKDRMQTTSTLANENLKWNAEERVERYNQKVKDTPTAVVKHILVRNRSVKRRNKIQDRWVATPMQVVSKPGSSVYTIQDVDGQGTRRVVNRAENREGHMKAQKLVKPENY